MAHSVARQMAQFDENHEVQRAKLHAQTKITGLNVERNQRGLQMDRTRKQMQSWAQPVALKREKTHRTTTRKTSSSRETLSIPASARVCSTHFSSFRFGM